MKTYCEKLQNLLAKDGPEAIRDNLAAREHLEKCADCFEFLEALAEIENTLQVPPAHVSDEVVEKVLEKVRSASEKDAKLTAETDNEKKDSLPKKLYLFLNRILSIRLPIPITLKQIGYAASILCILVISAAIIIPNFISYRGSIAPDSSKGASDLRIMDQGVVSKKEAEKGFYGKDSVSSVLERKQMPKAPVPASEPPKRDVKKGRASGGKIAPTKKLEGPVPPTKTIARVDEPAEVLADEEVMAKVGEPVPEMLAGIETESVGDDADEYDKKTESEETKVSGEREKPITLGMVSSKPDVTVPPPSDSSIEMNGNINGSSELSFSKNMEDRKEETSTLGSVSPKSGDIIAGEEMYESYSYSLNSSYQDTSDVDDWAIENLKDEKQKRENGHILTKPKPKIIVGEELDDQTGSGALRARKKTKAKRRKANASGRKVKSVERQLKIRQDLLNKFLKERSTIENLSFKEAKGYWSNTYVPGDPGFRWLDTRLKGWDRSAVKKYINTESSLDNAARKTMQPFDPPENSALGVYLHADQKSIDQKSRLLLQVGLKGTSRYSGSRPVMNVGVVLDLRGKTTPDTIKNIRALLQALSQAKDIGDRFSLIIAGKPGGLVIQPRDFKYGYLTVTLENLFNNKNEKVQKPGQRLGQPIGQKLGQKLGLIQAMQSAIDSVTQDDDPSSPLGSSEIILVTAQSIGRYTKPLSRMAHKSALAGIPVSVIGIGGQVKLEEMDQIVLSGQGNRRLLDQPVEAEDLIARELSSASRIIARAVRLRIRLAPGVKLVDVFGSKRLDAAASQRVRDAEKSIDVRLSKNLGIKSDRGEDEDGIQIVIPGFFAGDSHTILLDVVAPGPGPIADVTVKYKDLVKLKNGVARANLTLPRAKAAAGPLERNVIKNFIAFNLYRTLVNAGKALAGGNDTKCLNLINEYVQLLDAVQSRLPGFSRDTDIAGDMNMLNGFLTVINQGAAQTRKNRIYIADSLKFAGHLKVLPRPPSND